VSSRRPGAPPAARLTESLSRSRPRVTVTGCHHSLAGCRDWRKRECGRVPVTVTERARHGHWHTGGSSGPRPPSRTVTAAGHGPRSGIGGHGPESDGPINWHWKESESLYYLLFQLRSFRFRSRGPAQRRTGAQTVTVTEPDSDSEPAPAAAGELPPSLRCHRGTEFPGAPRRPRPSSRRRCCASGFLVGYEFMV
jgi:hypothetical protein